MAAEPRPDAIPAPKPGDWRILVPLLVGAAVAVGLGVYGKEHSPTGEAITTLGFPSMIAMKVWLSSVAAALALFQIGSALKMYGRLGSGHGPSWLGTAHRVSGVLAVLVSLPVAFHCLWSLGFSTFDTRTVMHSLLGCVFYGAFVAKMLTLKMRGLPGWALPVLGGLVFATLIGIWLTSAYWYFTTVGVPQ
jgi:hypothetical protein